MIRSLKSIKKEKCWRIRRMENQNIAKAIKKFEIVLLVIVVFEFLGLYGITPIGTFLEPKLDGVSTF